MEWAAEPLYNKARVYFERAHQQPVHSQLFATWASLALEILCRAALAKIHPVLLADPREDGNILYAFGIQPAKPPKSIVTKAIVIRCALLIKGFTEEMSKHCAFMADRRNAELHSGALGFDGINNAAWLPATYEVVDVLLKHLGYSLDEFLGVDHAPTAREMLRDHRETIKKEVLDRISAARKMFKSLPEAEVARRTERLEVGKKSASNKPIWQIAKCPACASDAFMTGEIKGRGPVQIDEANTTIVRETRVLPTKFYCVLCDLRLDGFHEMRHAQLGDMYIVMENEDPVEFFGIDPNDYIDPEEFARTHFGPEYDNE